jgi:hypothetical protein
MNLDHLTLSARSVTGLQDNPGPERIRSTANPFSAPAPDRVAFECPFVLALWDAFPASPGHLS